MAINFVECDVCLCRFRVTKINKPYIGMYKNKPVFHWHYCCVSCGHVHTVRFYNEYVNPIYDRVVSLEFSLLLNRKDEEKYGQLLREYEIANTEYESIVNMVVMGLLNT